MSAFPSRRQAADPGAEPGYRRRWSGWFRPLVLLVGIGVGLWLLWPILFPPKPQIRTAMVVEEVRSAAKLATVELDATVVANRDESAWYGPKFLFMVVPGKAAVGVDLEGLPADAIQVAGDKVTVTLPAPKVLYVEPDLTETQVYTAVGLLRPQFTPEETRSLLQESQDKLRTKAGAEAVIRRARTQTTELVTKLLTAAGAKQVEVKWGN